MQFKKLLIPSLIVSLIAVFMVFTYIKDLKNSVVGQTAKIEVIVAKKNISAGTALSKEMLKSQQISKDFEKLPVVKPSDINHILGQSVNHTIEEGAPILFSDIVTQSSKELFSRVENGQRAISIDVSASSGVSYLLRPGDHVDVLTTFDVPEGYKTRGRITRTILQDVTVLAVGSFMGSGNLSDLKGLSASGNYTTVTVLVPPEAVEILVFVKEVKKGEITLTLRNRDDSEIKELQDFDFSKIFDVDSMQTIQNVQNEMQKKTRAKEAENIPVIGGGKKK